jgi:anti-sigma factor RsiW
MKISNRDWVQLSAYLDGELNRRDKIQLEKRLKVNPDLQAALEELKITRDVLGKTPRLQVPRNFTLSPAQIGIKTRKPVYKGFRLAAAVMSFIFIGILILDFGGIFLAGSFAPAMATKSQDVMFDAAAESAVDELEEPALLAAEAENDRATEEEFGEEVSAPAEAADAEVEVMEEVAVSAAETEKGLAEEELAPSAEAEAVEEIAPVVGAESPGEAKTTSAEETAEGDTLADQYDDQARTNQAVPSPTAEGLPLPTQAVTYADEPSRWEIQREPISTLRILEIIFGLAIIGFGAAAWVLRRRNLK